MSSVEAMITELQEEYDRFAEMIRNLITRQVVEETAILELLKKALDFQRKLEYDKHASAIFSGSPYFERTIGRFQVIIDYFTTQKVLRKTKSKSYYDIFYDNEPGEYYTDSMEGINYEIGQILERTRARVQTAVSRSLHMIDRFLHEQLQIALLELYGDLRLIASLTIFPIEEKIKVKSLLVDQSFGTVAEFLESAEQNYVLNPPHLKDTLSNCRHALESMITILLNKLDQKPIQKFSIDLGTLSRVGFLDAETKGVVLSIWSYLSMKGSHSYSTVDKKFISDVDFGSEQTYRILSQLLTKYEAYLREKRHPS